MALWRHIRDNQLPWCLILEDDVHFHPDFIPLFREYWQHVPQEAKIIFPGHCGAWALHGRSMPVTPVTPFCTHGYLLSHEGAQLLLENILPVDDAIDLAMRKVWRKRPALEAVIFNGKASLAGIRPHDYKQANKNFCIFEGIIYQNRKEYSSTLI